MSARRPIPRWADIALLPALNLFLAFLVSGLVVLLIGENPLEAIEVIIYGAFGYGDGFGYTLYYATNFIFTGLAVAVAAHAGLFNIGGDGQAYVAGLGAIVVALALDQTHWLIAMPLAVIAAGAVGGFWAFIPGYLQAKRGSHVVITTIMFNFIASALMVYMVNRVLKPAATMAPESRDHRRRRPRAAAARVHRLLRLFAGQSLHRRRHPGADRRLYPGLAHQVRLRHAHAGPEPDRVALCRHFQFQDDHDHHDHFRRAGRHGGDQRGHGRAEPPGARLCRRRRLCRHRRGADGPQPSRSASRWRRSCSARSTRAGRNCNSSFPPSPRK